MNLSLIDWLIMLIPLSIIAVVAVKTHGYAKSVADFMAASRVAGRYLVCNARGEAAFGAISAVAIFEMIYASGFCISWWQKLSTPVGLFIALSGYVVYRYRETRVMSMAQFFEVRYSKSFRILAGIMAFISGVTNYGIFPAVGARFFVYFCGLPDKIIYANMEIPTFAILMLIFLSIALFLTLTGGQLTIMVTDCLEGLLSQIFYVVVAAVLLMMFSWTQIHEAMSAVPAGKSLLDPFDTSQVKDFNFWYVLIGIFGSIFTYMSWQGGHAFNASAANPHEAKMGNILGSWRGYARGVMITLLGICAYTYMNHPDYAEGARLVNESLSTIDNTQLQTQMRTPVALAHALPVGVKGMLCSIMLFALLACDGSYMHSWGSIFIQDVVLPFRKKPFTPQQHLSLLRWSIVGVAVYGFLFSLLFKQTDYILMFFALTGAIFSGAGAAIIGGFYWKKGTNAGAWSAMVVGSSLAVGSILVQQVWSQLAPWLIKTMNHPSVTAYLSQHLNKFPINGQYMWFIAMLSSLIVYVVVSLLTCRENFNMEKMLHRGQYAVETRQDGKPVEKYKFTWGSFLGFDRDFTLGDKWISGGMFYFGMFFFVIFIIISLWNLVARWPLSWWSHYWRWFSILIPMGIGILTTVWFTWGGVKDLRILFKSLKTVKRNPLDGGMVVGHHNLDEESEVPAGEDKPVKSG